LIVDDYQLIEECRDAVDAFRRQHGITEPIEEIDWNGVRWRRASAPPEHPRDAAGAREVSPRLRDRYSARAVDRSRHNPIPTERELAVEYELSRLRQRHAASEAVRERLRRSRLGRWAARLGRPAGRGRSGG
jgi:hypothetical protein